MNIRFSQVIALALAAALSGCSEKTEGPSTPSAPSLILAAEQGDLAQLDSLLGQASSVDVRDSCAWTPLMKAAQNGHLQSVERLLMAGAQTRLGDKGGYTALMLAAAEGHVEIVRLLLEFGADINHREQTRGWTALIWAAKRGHLATVQALIEAGAETRFLDKSGKSALDWATPEHPLVAAYLESHPST